MIAFVVSGRPQPKERAAPDKFGNMRTPEATLIAERHVEELSRKAMRGLAPLAGAVRLSLNIIFETPASWNKAQKIAAIEGKMPHVSTPDADNVLKMISDGMNGIVYYDDAQVAELFVRKRYGQGERVEVMVDTIAAPENHPALRELQKRISSGKYALPVGQQRRRRPRAKPPETISIGKRIK